MRAGQSSRAKTGVRRQGTILSKSAKDFMILCPAVAENSGVLEALYALYYLPHNYKLVISEAGAKSRVMYQKVRELVRKESLTDRVILPKQTGLPEMVSPFSYVDVVVYGNSDPVYSRDAAQSIVVFDVASRMSNVEGQHNFAVSATTPEALASAILTVARRQKRATA